MILVLLNVRLYYKVPKSSRAKKEKIHLLLSFNEKAIYHNVGHQDNVLIDIHGGLVYIDQLKGVIMIRFIQFCVVGIIIFVFSGCSSQPPINFTEFKPLSVAVKPEPVIPKDYRLHCGDIVEIKFFYNPKLNESLHIRPDGKISLQLIDDIQAAGLTPMELDRALTKKYTELLSQPELTVIVREFAGQKIYVGGEVRTPGLFNLSGKITALQAIIQAGGFLNTAALSNIIILRNQGSGNPMFRILNLKRDLVKHSQTTDILLQPYDVIYVPKTTIAKIGQFVDQYIRQLIPVSTTFGFSYLKGLN